MYSEDDIKEEKPKAKKQKSSSKKEEKKEEKVEKEEEFYDDFYNYLDNNEEEDNDDDIDDEPDLELVDKKKKRFRIAIIVVLSIILIFLIVLVTRSCDHKMIVEDKKEDVVIKNEVIELSVGDKSQIEYQAKNFKVEPVLTFVSLDPNVVTISDDGKIEAKGVGETEIIVSYFVDEVSYEKKCSVVVKEKEVNPKPVDDEVDKDAPVISANITNAKNNTWTNHDVIIKVSAKDKSKVTLQYVFDCTNNCKYTNVSNGEIKVDKNGTTIVNIQAVDSHNNKSSKTFTIKIDKKKPTCFMTVSEIGDITATANDDIELSYYGFDSSYTGNNTKTLSAHNGTYTYYVKDHIGNTNTCTITIKSKVQYRSRTCKSKNNCTEWSEYQDEPIKETSTIKVDQKTIFYS